MIQYVLNLSVKLFSEDGRGTLGLLSSSIKFILVEGLKKTDMEGWMDLQPVRQLQPVRKIPNLLENFEGFIIKGNKSPMNSLATNQIPDLKSITSTWIHVTPSDGVLFLLKKVRRDVLASRKRQEMQ